MWQEDHWKDWALCVWYSWEVGEFHKVHFQVIQEVDCGHFSFIRSQKTFDSASQPKLRGTSHLPFQIPFSWQSCQGPYSQIGLLLFNWPPSRIIGALLHFMKRLGKSLSWNNLWLLHLILLWCKLLGPECRNLRILQKVLQNSKIYCMDKSVTAKLIFWWNESSIVYLHP